MKQSWKQCTTQSSRPSSLIVDRCPELGGRAQTTFYQHNYSTFFRTLGLDENMSDRNHAFIIDLSFMTVHLFLMVVHSKIH